MTTPLWAATAAGMLAGAALGGLLLHANSTSEVTALVRLYQPIDPNQIMTASTPSSDLEQSYMSGEVAYLNSPGFADTVAKQLDETTPPRLSAAQNSQSTTVTVSTTQPNVAEAKRMVDAALRAYGDHLRQQAVDRGRAAIDALDGVIGSLQNPATGPAQPPLAAETQARIEQLQQQRLAIEVQTQRSAPMQIVQPPTKTPITGAPSLALGAVGGGLAGGLLTLAGVLAWRKRVGVITSPAVLANQIEHVLLPVVRLGAWEVRSAPYARLARSLFAQLPAPRSGQILVVGASAQSGTEQVAELVASAAAEHSDVCIEHLPDGYESFDWLEAPADSRTGITTVIDAGSVDTSPTLPKAAEGATQIVIVAMIGRDVNTAVRVASQLARDTEVPISGVCTRGPILRIRPSRRTRSCERRTPDSAASSRAAVTPEAPVLWGTNGQH